MTHVTDGVTYDIVWIQGTRMPWFNIRLDPEKRKKRIHFIYVLYMFYVIYIVDILYIAYICRVKSEWYINRTNLKHILWNPHDRWC